MKFMFMKDAGVLSLNIENLNADRNFKAEWIQCTLSLNFCQCPLSSKLVYEKIDAYSKITFISGKLIINLTLTKNQNWSLDFVTGVLTVQINMSV